MGNQYTATIWTTADLRYVEAHYLTHTDRELADRLGRSQDAITKMRRRKGWTHPKPSSPSNRVGAGENGARATLERLEWTPDRPKGFSEETLVWASDNPTHPEAVLILAMHREGILRAA